MNIKIILLGLLLSLIATQSSFGKQQAIPDIIKQNPNQKTHLNFLIDKMSITSICQVFEPILGIKIVIKPTAKGIPQKVHKINKSMTKIQIWNFFTMLVKDCGYTYIVNKNTVSIFPKFK